MEASTVSFSKTATCPSSNILLSYRNGKLPQEVRLGVQHHLSNCDFCNAEIPLLAHYSAPQKDEPKPTEIPINLRILAESLLAQSFRRLAAPVASREGRRNNEEPLGHLAR